MADNHIRYLYDLQEAKRLTHRDKLDETNCPQRQYLLHDSLLKKS